VQDTDWTDLSISDGEEFRAADRARAWFLIHGSPLRTTFTHRFSGLSFHGFSRHSAAVSRVAERANLVPFITKEALGIHALLVRSLFGGGIPRRLLLRVSLAKPTSAPWQF